MPGKAVLAATMTGYQGLRYFECGVIAGFERLDVESQRQRCNLNFRYVHFMRVS